MSQEIIGSWSINPLEVERVLNLSPSSYPKTSETEQFKGWSNVPVIPKLYKWTLQSRRMPMFADAMKYLQEIADYGISLENIRLKNRAIKLWMDYCREIHTYGLLQRNDAFSFVKYQAILDLNFNVDYVCELIATRTEDIGIQSAMRAKWNQKDLWSQIKEQRKTRRGCKEWKGPLYWLTNRFRSPKKINSCWLFTKAHISELVEEIRGVSESDPFLEIGIQSEFDFETKIQKAVQRSEIEKIKKELEIRSKELGF